MTVLTDKKRRKLLKTAKQDEVNEEIFYKPDIFGKN